MFDPFDADSGPDPEDGFDDFGDPAEEIGVGATMSDASQGALYPSAYSAVSKLDEVCVGSGPCPICGDRTIRRMGRFGHFWGCVRYPKCLGTRDEAKPVGIVETLSLDLEDLGATTVELARFGGEWRTSKILTMEVRHGSWRSPRVTYRVFVDEIESLKTRSLSKAIGQYNRV